MSSKGNICIADVSQLKICCFLTEGQCRNNPFTLCLPWVTVRTGGFGVMDIEVSGLFLFLMMILNHLCIHLNHKQHNRFLLHFLPISFLEMTILMCDARQVSRLLNSYAIM